MKEYRIIFRETKEGGIQITMPLISATPESSITELLICRIDQVVQSIQESINEEPDKAKNIIYEQIQIHK